MLNTIKINAQRFLSCKRTRGKQLGLTPHVGWGGFGRHERKCLQQEECDTNSDSNGLWIDSNPKFNLGRSPRLLVSQSPQTDVADVERRWKGKERLVEESSRPDSSLIKCIGTANPIVDAAHNATTKSKHMSASDLVVLSDEDEPILDPENDKFNLAN